MNAASERRKEFLRSGACGPVSAFADTPFLMDWRCEGTAMLDLDKPLRGVRDCPKCHWTMEFLKAFNAQERDEGFLLDYSDTNIYDHPVTATLFAGERGLMEYLRYHVVTPLLSRWLGRWKQRRYARIVRDFPATLICPHCGHLIRRK